MRRVVFMEFYLAKNECSKFLSGNVYYFFNSVTQKHIKTPYALWKTSKHTHKEPILTPEKEKKTIKTHTKKTLKPIPRPIKITWWAGRCNGDDGSGVGVRGCLWDGDGAGRGFPPRSWLTPACPRLHQHQLLVFRHLIEMSWGGGELKVIERLVGLS